MKKNCLLAGLLSLAILPSFAGTKIACVGDSITYGSGISNRETNSYPYFLQKLLGDGYEVVNFGNPGKTAGDFPGQVGRWYGSTREHQEAVAFEGDIYVCNLGINDTGVWWNAGLFVQGYQNLIDQWRGKRKDVPVIIWTRLGPDFRGEPGKKAFPGNVFPERKYSAKGNGSSAKRGEAEKLLQKIARKKRRSRWMPMPPWLPTPNGTRTVCTPWLPAPDASPSSLARRSIACARGVRPPR
ncbi:MAG: GDSL-type esterase/lipase family protein [Akkermansia sp.]|nr:GDSL-type esterase/lipase family protein [Akkermansia sp.]